MNKDKRITTIVLDREADRKSKIIAEFTGKTLSAIYREALDVYFEKFIEKELLPVVDSLENKLWVYFKSTPSGAWGAIKEHKYSEAAMLLAEKLKQLPDDALSDRLTKEGIRLISILSK